MTPAENKRFTSFLLRAAEESRKLGYAGIQASAIQCAAIVGRTPKSYVEKHSFDLHRHSLTNVTTLTFDELLGKLKAIESVLGKRNAHEERDET